MLDLEYYDNDKLRTDDVKGFVQMISIQYSVDETKVLNNMRLALVHRNAKTLNAFMNLMINNQEIFKIQTLEGYLVVFNLLEILIQDKTNKRQIELIKEV